MNKTLLTLSVFAALGALTACGGGGGSTSAANKTVTGVVTAKSIAAAPAAGVAVGGSTLTVNGATYALDSRTSIDSDDSPADESAIAEGDVVTLEVSDDDGDGQWTATTIEYDDELQGFVLENHLAADGAGGFTGTLMVMGKTVHVSAGTVYEQGDGDKATLGLLAKGDAVEVSGFPDADGDVIATRIEGKDPSEDIEVKGVISNLDTAAQTFTLGTLIVDYSAADTSDLTGGPSEGLYVEVKGPEEILAFTDNGDGTYTLAAIEVELEDGGDLDEESAAEGDDMEASIYVLTVDAGGVATLNGYTLVVNTESGITEGQLAALADQLIEVEGYLENGNLVVSDAQAI